MSLVDEFFGLLCKEGVEVFNDKTAGGGICREGLLMMLKYDVNPTPDRAKKVRVVRGSAGDQFLYVLESSTKRGFWGPDKNVINALAGQSEPWSLILLHESSTCGYWFPSVQVLTCTARGEWRIGGDGYSYKVNAPNQVARGEKFITPKKLLRLIGHESVRPSQV